MKKTEKGTPGYLSYKKRIEIIRTIIYFGIVAAIFLLGYFQTKTRLNLFTVAAVLGCLPVIIVPSETCEPLTSILPPPPTAVLIDSRSMDELILVDT